MDKTLFNLAEKVGQRLLTTNNIITTAESCTGGWVAKCFTDIAGSSRWFDRGFIVYNAQAKQQMLSVPSDILRLYGEVSEHSVTALAQGALAKSRATVSVAISGIAGPGGGSTEKPVGLVWFAWAYAEHKNAVFGNVNSHAQQQLFSGDRESVRYQSVHYAMQGVLDLLDN